MPSNNRRQRDAVVAPADEMNAPDLVSIIRDMPAFEGVNHVNIISTDEVSEYIPIEHLTVPLEDYSPDQATQLFGVDVEFTHARHATVRPRRNSIGNYYQELYQQYVDDIFRGSLAKKKTNDWYVPGKAKK